MYLYISTNKGEFECTKYQNSRIQNTLESLDNFLDIKKP